MEQRGGLSSGNPRVILAVMLLDESWLELKLQRSSRPNPIKEI